jgi:hypothetical protein
MKDMKRPLWIAVILLSASVVPCFAQNGGEVGLFGEYLRTQTNPTVNFAGIGGRLSFNASPLVQLEAEVGYDFKRTYTSASGTGASATTTSSTVRPLTLLFGPKLQSGGGPVRVFGTVKGGVINFSVSNQSATSGFVSAVGSLPTSSATKFALYPGAGLEAYLGPIGLRLDVGDLMYFGGGTHNDLRITFGPSIRF